VDSRPVRLILDTSAIVAFTRASVHVGEVIAEIDAEDAAVGLPTLCLVEAVRSVAYIDRLDLLVEHPAVVQLADPTGWRAMAATADIVGRLDAAVAALLAIDLDVDVMSGVPGLYAGVGDGDLVIEI
jgi:hypothetical protein